MGEAFLVNPIDEERTAQVIDRALRLDEEERRERMLPLHERVLHNNVFAWGDRFLAALLEAAGARARLGELEPRTLNVGEAVAAYRKARRRMLMLDYDGTLVPFTADPRRAVPPPALLDILRRLVADPANCTAVISGRRAADLERWLGDIPGLVLAAEHGAFLRSDGEWKASDAAAAATDWKRDVRPVLDHFVDRTPGSFVEEKQFALVWHYRLAEPEFGEWLANELVAMLENLLAQTELRAYRGRKVVEVKPLWVTKGSVPERLRPIWPDADYLFASGDDRTDEDLFAALPESAWTVHVGPGDTRADFTLPDVGAVRNLLERFAR
jgi:trehalose 6-phosphate synthase/phosphatase